MIGSNRTAKIVKELKTTVIIFLQLKAGHPQQPAIG
jgi:hypothetical protein